MASRIIPHTLVKENYSRNLNLIAIKVPNANLAHTMKEFRGHLLTLPKVKCIMVLPQDNDHKLLLLAERYQKPELPPNLASFVQSQQYSVFPHTLNLGYDNLTADQVLRDILPEDLAVPSAFETIGHIAHLNLRDRYLPYKHLIGQVILDKFGPRITTVLNKVGKIENQYRVFQMEVLAGSDDLNTEVSESDCKFKLNFGEVYWNSRLQMEHGRLVSLFKKTDIICDMFAGIGPFAVPAAKHVGCQVHANDLNPSSFKYLQINATLNKVQPLIRCYNMDARDFVRLLVTGKKPDNNSNNNTDNNVNDNTQTAPDKHKPVPFTQVIMNLPASAVEFLDVFRGLYHGIDPHQVNMPMIHCYGFSYASNVKEDIVKQVEHILGPIKPQNVYEVRDVAPKKQMMCISFELPQEIAFADPSLLPPVTPYIHPEHPHNNNNDNKEPSAKKQKL